MTPEDHLKYTNEVRKVVLKLWKLQRNLTFLFILFIHFSLCPKVCSQNCKILLQFKVTDFYVNILKCNLFLRSKLNFTWSIRNHEIVILFLNYNDSSVSFLNLWHVRSMLWSHLNLRSRCLWPKESSCHLSWMKPLQSFQPHSIIISVFQTFKSQKYWDKSL